MRRRSFNRPKEKLRGIKRRLNAIDNWANSFEGYFPVEHSSEKYWNYKIPVLDRLVCPPTTTDELQAHCVVALLRAAEFLVSARPREHQKAKVSVLVTYPDMFGSEICVFFDKSYLKAFFERSSEKEQLNVIKGNTLSCNLTFEVPSIFFEHGYMYKTKEEWEGEVTEYQEQWWSYHE